MSDTMGSAEEKVGFGLFLLGFALMQYSGYGIA